MDELLEGNFSQDDRENVAEKKGTRKRIGGKKGWPRQEKMQKKTKSYKEKDWYKKEDRWNEMAIGDEGEKEVEAIEPFSSPPRSEDLVMDKVIRVMELMEKRMRELE